MNIACRHGLTYDRRPDVSAKSIWMRARRVEQQYAVQLRKIAHSIDTLTKQFDPDQWSSNGWIVSALEKYAQTIEPWAKAAGGRMVAEVAARDKQAWQKVSAQMGRALHREIESAPTGFLLKQRLADQVELITSLPREAAERVHKLTLEGITEGTRASSLVDKIMETGDIARSRATMIARTEVSRTSTELTKARAEYVGSTGYIWRTSGDSDVRASHKAMNGKFVEWNAPPTLDKMIGHAGCLPNCRCFCEVTVPD